VPQKRAFRWWSNREQVAWSTGRAIAPVVLMSIGYEGHWTGFGLSLVDGQSEPAKTLWDWLDLLIITVVLALGGYLFNWSQNKATRGSTKERARHEALQAYLAKMSELLINGKLHEKDDQYDPTRITARAQTLAVLRQLDGEGKKNVLLFLREARLINRFNTYDPKHKFKVLYHAHYVGLRDADLREADLERAQLISTSGKEPISLQGANLKDAKLSGARLSGADLRGADLGGADLGGAKLEEADLGEDIVPDAVLEPPERRKANLTGANLSGANLRSAVGITNKELAQQARSLVGATMPNGQKYEAWLKNKDSREGVGNTGPS
jgi:uncharacterized protein YjbI with pentapeptide repeats